MTSTKGTHWANMTDEEWERYLGMEDPTYEPQRVVSHEPRQLYFAYGSNLHVPQMKYRCPDALQAEPGLIMGWQLVFRGVADIEPTNDPTDRVEGGFWWVSESDEEALDRYEGVNPHNQSNGMYRKVYFDVTLPGKSEPERCLTYLMNSQEIQPPSAGYFKTIADGYCHFRLDGSQLLAALTHSHQERSNSKRHRRAAKWKKGKLSKPVSVKAGSGLLERIRAGKILVCSR